MSDRWTYQRHSRRWSRLDSVDLLSNPPSTSAVDHGGSAEGGLTTGTDWTLDGSLRSTASWDSALEASLIGSNSSTLAARRRDAQFPPVTDDVPPSSTSPLVAVSADPGSSCESDRSSLGGDAASPGPRRSAAGDRLRGACRRVLQRMKLHGPSSPTAASPAGPATSPVEISSPIVVDEVKMRARMNALRCVDLQSSDSVLPANTGHGHSAPATPTNERSSAVPVVDVDDRSLQSLQRRRRQRSLDSAARTVSIYDNVVTSPPISDDDPQRQLDFILSALYRDIGMLSSSLAVVSEEQNHAGSSHSLQQRLKSGR